MIQCRLLFFFVVGCWALEVRILGAGVVGLTSALVLQENGWDVVIHAESSPENMLIPSSVPYASPKAGAWWSGAQNPYTYHSYITYKKEAEQPLSTVMHRSANILYTNPLPQNLSDLLSHNKYVQDWKNFSSLELLQWKNKFLYGYRMSAIMLTAPDYISYLLTTFKKNGGIIIHEKVHHISELADKEGVSLVINCAGLGSRTLGGVEDSTVFAERGQVVIVKNPAITEIFRSRGAIDDSDPGNYGTYILPRSNGEIIVGGTRSKNDSEIACGKDRENILRRAKFLCPAIADAEILRDSVGLRPSRVDGIRLELDLSFSVPVIHNYGHGGAGFESAWGCANHLLSIINDKTQLENENGRTTSNLLVVGFTVLLVLSLVLLKPK